MAMNPLYDPSVKGTSSGDFGPKAEAWQPQVDGDKIRGTIVFVGKPWDKPKDPRFIKADTPEHQKTQKSQKIVIETDKGQRAIYLNGVVPFKKLGEAMAEHGLTDFGDNVIGWGLGHKWDGFYVDDFGKAQKNKSFKLFPPAN